MKTKIDIKNEHIACSIDDLIKTLQFIKENNKEHYNIYFNGYYLINNIVIDDEDKSIVLCGFPVINEEID